MNGHNSSFFGFSNYLNQAINTLAGDEGNQPQTTKNTNVANNPYGTRLLKPSNEQIDLDFNGNMPYSNSINFRNRNLSVMYSHQSEINLYAVQPATTSGHKDLTLKYQKLPTGKIHAKSRSTYHNLRQEIARTRLGKSKSQLGNFDERGIHRSSNFIFS